MPTPLCSTGPREAERTIRLHDPALTLPASISDAVLPHPRRCAGPPALSSPPGRSSCGRDRGTRGRRRASRGSRRTPPRNQSPPCGSDEGDHGDPPLCASAALRAPGRRTAPSMSGSPRSRGSRPAGVPGELSASPPVVASSVRNPAARSTSRASRRFRSLSSTTRTSGLQRGPALSRAFGAEGHGRILRACRSGSCSPRITTCREGFAGSWTSPRVRGRSRLRGSRRAARDGRGRAARPGRHGHPHAADRDRRGDPGGRAAARDEAPTSASSSSASTRAQATPWRSSTAAARAGPTS